jgi:hypothetical protein
MRATQRAAATSAGKAVLTIKDTMRGASALDVAIQLRQWAVDERSFGQSIEYSDERPPGARDVLALERILRGGPVEL